MKQLKIWSIMMLMAMALPVMVACGGDDDNDNAINKSELIGTWYTLEDDWVFAFTESTVTLYELWKSSGKYMLNPSYSVTQKYTINGNMIVTEDGRFAIVTTIDNNTIRVNIDNEMLTLTKFNGTPQQLIDYLNKK